MITRISSLLFIAVVPALICLGCDSSTTPPTTQPTRATMPKEGSYLVFSAVYIDSNGVAHDRDSITITVVESGIEYAGKTNVVVFRNGPVVGGPSGSQDLSYQSYEANGDVMSYTPYGGPGSISGWQLIPLTSKGSPSFVVHDSTYTRNGSPYRDLQTENNIYSGAATLTKAGHSFSTAIITATHVLADSTKLYTDSTWFAPEIGYIVQERVDYTLDKGHAHIDLARYSIK